MAGHEAISDERNGIEPWVFLKKLKVNCLFEVGIEKEMAGRCRVE